MECLHGLLAPAFQKQRESLGVTKESKGLIVADGWAGFHSADTETSRLAWSQQHAVYLPDLQPGGFSANCQPVDQLHHLLRARMDIVDAESVGCPGDFASRERRLLACIVLGPGHERCCNVLQRTQCETNTYI